MPTYFLPALFLLAMSLTGLAHADDELIDDGIHVETAYDLQQLGEASKQKRVPILLEFSADHCPFCYKLEEEFLKPMLRNDEYLSKIIIRKIDLSGYLDLTDFNGQKIRPDQFANRYGVFVTPTVLIVDGSGKERSKRLIGINSVDYYGGELDDAIDSALKKINP